MPGKPWGVRSIPEIDSRYPLWDQPNFIRDVDLGRFYLPDAEEGLRETIVTTPIDARPIQVQRLPGNSFITIYAALTTGGFSSSGRITGGGSRPRVSSWRSAPFFTGCGQERPGSRRKKRKTSPSACSFRFTRRVPHRW